jgi:hypothetical protein
MSKIVLPPKPVLADSRAKWLWYHFCCSLALGLSRNLDNHSDNRPYPICYYCFWGKQHVTDDMSWIDCNFHHCETAFCDVCHKFEYPKGLIYPTSPKSAYGWSEPDIMMMINELKKMDF